jgi:hypothetical protein
LAHERDPAKKDELRVIRHRFFGKFQRVTGNVAHLKDLVTLVKVCDDRHIKTFFQICYFLFEFFGSVVQTHSLLFFFQTQLAGMARRRVIAAMPIKFVHLDAEARMPINFEKTSEQALLH